MPLPKLQVQGTNRVYTGDNGETKTYSGAVTPEEGLYYATGSTTPDTTKVTRYPSSTSTSGTSGVTAANKAYQASITPESDADIESRIQGEYADSLAAIRSKYADITAEHMTDDKAQEGRTRAASSANGTLGGDFGNAQQSTAERATSNDLQSVRDAQAADEESVLSQVRSGVESERQGQKATYQKATSDNLAAAQQKVKDTQAMIQQVAGATSLDQLDQSEYDTLYANSGFESPELFNSFYEAAHQAALSGTKLLGDATTGYYVPQVGADGQVSYKNVIPAIVKPTQYGAYTFDASTGDVKTIAPAQPKIVSSGGRLWSIDPKTNDAIALTPASAASTGKVGWQSANTDQQIAAYSFIEREATSAGKDPKHYLDLMRSNPDAFLVALNGAVQAHLYTAAAVTPYDQVQTDSTDSSNQDAIDAATNASLGN